jgi:hypothetical protein
MFTGSYALITSLNTGLELLRGSHTPSFLCVYENRIHYVLRKLTPILEESLGAEGLRGEEKPVSS